MAKKSASESKVLKNKGNVPFESGLKKEKTTKSKNTKKTKNESTVVLNVDADVAEKIKNADNLVINGDKHKEEKLEDPVANNNEVVAEDKVENSNEENTENTDNPKKSKKGLIIFLIVLFLVLAGVGTGLGIYFGTKKPVVYDETRELIEENEYTQMIIDNVDISNYKIEVGKDFETTISMKEKSVNNYRLNDLTVYTLKQTSQNTNAETKVKLYKDRDYTYSLNDDESIGKLKVFKEAFDNKIILDLTFKIITFNDLVDFDATKPDEKYTFAYDGKEHPVKVNIKSGRSLPDDTQITYIYEKNGTKYPIVTDLKDHKCHSFTELGTYPVTIKLHSKYVQEDFENKAVCNIFMSELSNEEKNQLKFVNTRIRVGTNDEVTFTELTSPQEQPDKYAYETKPVVEYNYGNDENWLTTKPESKGQYPIRVIYKFKFFKYVTIEGTCQVTSYADISVNFNVKDENGKWDDGTDADKCDNVNKVEVMASGTMFSLFKEKSIKSSIPTKEGYTFKGWYRKSDKEQTIINDNDLITDSEGFTVCAKFEINSYNLKFTYDSEAIVFVDSVPTGPIPYGTNVIVKVRAQAKYKIKGAYVNLEKTTLTPIDDYYQISFNMPATDTSVIIYAVGDTQKIYYMYDSDRVTVTGDSTVTGSKEFKFHYVDNGGFKVQKVYMYTNIQTEGKELEVRPWEFEYSIKLGDQETEATIVFLSIANFHNLSFDANGGDTAPTPLEVPYSYGINEILNAQEPKLEATHTYAAFRGWMESAEGDTLIQDTVTMPDQDKTLYASWYKYKFVFKSLDGVVEVENGVFENKTHLTKEDLNNVIFKPVSGMKSPREFKVYVEGDSTFEEFTTDLSKPLAPGKFAKPIKKDNITINLIPQCETQSYKVSFFKNGASYITNSSSFTSCNFNTKILPIIVDKKIAPDNPYAGFNHWEDSDGKRIDDNYRMPDHDLTIKPIWDTYRFKIVDNGEGNLGYTVKTDDLSGFTELSLDQFKFSLTAGYVLDYVDMRTGGANWERVRSDGMISPYERFRDVPIKQGDTVEVRIHCKRTVDLFLYANGGFFDGGDDYRVFPIKLGTKWYEISKMIPEPVCAKKMFNGWVDEEGKPIEDNKVFDENTTLFATWYQFSSEVSQ